MHKKTDELYCSHIFIRSHFHHAGGDAVDAGRRRASRLSQFHSISFIMQIGMLWLLIADELHISHISFSPIHFAGGDSVDAGGSVELIDTGPMDQEVLGPHNPAATKTRSLPSTKTAHPRKAPSSSAPSCLASPAPHQRPMSPASMRHSRSVPSCHLC